MTGITQRLDSLPMTRTTWTILLVLGIGLMFDAMDQGMVSGVNAALGEEWGLSKTEMSVLLSSGTIGMMIGAALSGFVADRYGRRYVVITTLLIYSFGSAMCGLSVNYWMLLVFRFVTGFGLGGEIPAAMTLMSELSPKATRGRNTVLVESFWAWGWIVASLVAYLLIPVYGWRMAFFVGAVPALFAALIRRGTPESPRYLDITGRSKEAHEIVSKMERAAGLEPSEYSEEPHDTVKAGGFARIWSKSNRLTTFVVWVIWFGINFGYYGFVLWTPTLLMDQGFTMVKSFEFTVIMCLAQLPGYFLASYLIERIGRKPTIVLFFAGTAVAAWLFGQATSETMVLAYGCLLYFFALGSWGTAYSYTPELYPTDVRGSGFGWGSAFGRVGAFIAPFIVPALYEMMGQEAGFVGVFTVLSIAFVAVAVVVLIWGRETKGKDLEDLSS